MSTTIPREIRDHKLTWLGILAIVMAGIVVYSNTFNVPFILDDKPHIQLNESIRNAWPPSASMAETNRPFAIYTFAINYAVHGYELWGYHATNLAIHITAGLLLFGILRRSLMCCRGNLKESATTLSFLVAILWTVHPLQTQAVTYLIQRLESLMGLCYLATLYLFIHAQHSTTSERWYAASILMCALGMGCKEVMVTAPLIVLWYDRAWISNSWRELLTRRWLYYLGLFATWGVLAWSMLHYTVEYQGGKLVSVEGLTPWTYLLSQSEVLVYYLRLLVWPSGQCFDYAWPVRESLSEVWQYGLFILTLLGATIWAIFCQPRWSILGGWFFLILAPTSSVLPIIDLVFEHRMYLPSAAVISLVVIGGWTLLNYLLTMSRSVGYVVVTFAMLLVSVYAVVAYQRNEVYSTEMSIWKDVTEKAAHNRRAWLQLGVLYENDNQFDKAIQCHLRALEIEPGNAISTALLGELMLRKGNYEQAHQLLSAALEVAPNHFETQLNMGHLYTDMGRFSEAVKHYRIAHKLKPEKPDPQISLSGALIPLGQYAEAERICRELIAENQENPLAHLNLANARFAQGDIPQAIEQFQQTLKLDPNSAEAYAGLAQVLAKSNPRASYESMQSAIKLKPNSVKMLLGMGNLLAAQNPQLAIPYFERAILLQPGIAETRFNLANALVAIGNLEQAIAQLEVAVQIRPEWEAAQNNLKILRKEIR